eukprot:TRINITY_DN2541_c0_g1_i1.p1 TRINITY_DN2541_c0_g1~~TRINITY_DN2541_c0_g1_i1.p1  ORF type:complete len:408 (+),score=32.69 TRINITY_DN2541_c0_g1_i1:503-1726(+)
MAAHALVPGGEFIDSDGIPWRFLCPITHELFTDPVRTSATCHSRAFERSAIADWLQGHDVDPVSREILRHKNLTPDAGLRREVQAFRAALGQVARETVSVSPGALPLLPSADRTSPPRRAGGDANGRLSDGAGSDGARRGDVEAASDIEHVVIDLSFLPREDGEQPHPSFPTTASLQEGTAPVRTPLGTPPLGPVQEIPPVVLPPSPVPRLQLAPPGPVFVPSHPSWEGSLGELGPADKSCWCQCPTQRCGHYIRVILWVIFFTLGGALGGTLTGASTHCHRIQGGWACNLDSGAGAAAGAVGCAIVFLVTEGVTAVLTDDYPGIRKRLSACCIIIWFPWNWLRLALGVVVGAVILPSREASPTRMAGKSAYVPGFLVVFGLFYLIWSTVLCRRHHYAATRSERDAH